MISLIFASTKVIVDIETCMNNLFLYFNEMQYSKRQIIDFGKVPFYTKRSSKYVESWLWDPRADEQRIVTFLHIVNRQFNELQ